MAFEKKTWTDRISEYITRRKLTNVSSGTEQIVDVERFEGEISQTGDAFSAANMNDLEDRIDDALTDLEETLTTKINSKVTYNGSQVNSINFQLSGTTLTITTN